MEQNTNQSKPTVRRRYHAQPAQPELHAATPADIQNETNEQPKNQQAPARTRSKRYSPDGARANKPEQTAYALQQESAIDEPAFLASGSWPFPAPNPQQNKPAAPYQPPQPGRKAVQMVPPTPQSYEPAPVSGRASRQAAAPSGEANIRSAANAKPAPATPCKSDEKGKPTAPQEPAADKAKPAEAAAIPSGQKQPEGSKEQPLPHRTPFAKGQKQPEPADPEDKASEAPKKPKNSLKQTLYRLGVLLCTVVLVSSSAMLIKYFAQIHKANKASDQLRELYRDDATAVPAAADVTPSPTPSNSPDNASAGTQASVLTPTPTPKPSTPKINDNTSFLAMWPKTYPGNEQLRIQERFTPLRQQNRDVVGWLTIDGVLDEPVFQRDNSYYLTHDATGTSNPTGALFIDENCNLRTVPMQVLIHGHNMKEGAMFGSLKKYKVKDASFYREHPYIQFDSLYENGTYVIFAVAEVNIVAGNTHYFPFWHQFDFKDQESFQKYISLAKEYSRFKVDIDVQPGDRLLTLATCSSGDDNLRLIVMARRLRDDEDTVMLANQILSATAK